MKTLVYADFYQKYISKLDPDKKEHESLEEGLREILGTFKFLPSEKEQYRYAEGKWTVKELFGHMIDTERIMNYRALCIARGEKQLLPGFDENEYVTHANFNEQQLNDLIEQYKMVRFSTILLCKSFTEEMFDRTGNANGKDVNVRALMWIIAGHEKHHLEILRERYGVK